MSRGIEGTFSLCIVEGCDQKAVSKGYCYRHRVRNRTHENSPEFKARQRALYRARHGGPPVEPIPRPPKVCSVPGCGRKCEAMGLCKYHYDQTPERKAKAHESQVGRYAQFMAMQILCKTEGCTRFATSRCVKGLPTICRYHYGLEVDQLAKRRTLRERRRAMGIPCTYPGCIKLAIYHLVDGKPTLCSTHSMQNHPSYRNGNHPQLSLREQLGRRCAICGYDKLTPHAHRIKHGGKYVLENTIALCSNCHREVHEGLIAVDELLKYKQG